MVEIAADALQRLIQNLVVILFFQKNEHIGIIDLSVTAETVPGYFL